MTCTWLGVRSGKASKLMRESAQPPAATSTRVAATTATRKRSARSMIRSIMASSLRHLRARELSLDRERAGQHHVLARVDPAEDQGLAARRGAGGHGAARDVRAALSVGTGD